MVRPSSSGCFRSDLPYVRAGKGPVPLVIIQGLMFENKPQRGMIFGYGFLKKHYTVYSVLRKPGMPRGYSLKDMADDYAAMIREEFESPLDVIGVSTGGSIAQHFAADHPELVRRLVLHSSAHTLSGPAKELQREVAHLSQQGLVVRASEALMDFMLPHRGVWRFLAGPVGWFAARMMSVGASKSLNDLVITVEAEDRHSFQSRLS